VIAKYLQSETVADLLYVTLLRAFVTCTRGYYCCLLLFIVIFAIHKIEKLKKKKDKARKP